MVVDSHCHLHDPAFPDPLDALRVALAHDVWGVVAVGCDAETNARNLALAAAAPKTVWACLGFHPDQDRLTEADLEAVEQQLAEHHSRVVGVGEVGLPWYSLEGKADAAERTSRGRARLDRLLALERHHVERAVFHWHKAPAEVTRRIVDAGYFVSVTPEVVYRERDRALVEQVPLESLLVESDAPWKYGGEFAGGSSGPWLAARAAEEVAKVKREPLEDVMFRLSTNACRLFHLAWT